MIDFAQFLFHNKVYVMNEKEYIMYLVQWNKNVIGMVIFTHLAILVK